MYPIIDQKIVTGNDMAQWLAHQAENRKFFGSSPTNVTNFSISLTFWFFSFQSRAEATTTYLKELNADVVGIAVSDVRLGLK